MNEELNANIHNHSYRCGHASKEATDEDYVRAAKEIGLKVYGFADHVPYSSMEYPDPAMRMHYSQIDEYVESVKSNDSEDLKVLAGFESEYNPANKQFLCELREKVDYLVLGQHFVQVGLKSFKQNNNPKYPLEYAETVCKAIETGLFDVVGHPDSYMEKLESVKEENRDKFLENAKKANKMICETAKEYGIPLELNLHGIYDQKGIPDPKFWEEAKNTGNLVICNSDAHDPSQLLTMSKDIEKSLETIGKPRLNIVEPNYNPVIARENNPKLQEALETTKKESLSYETYITLQALKMNAGKEFNFNKTVNTTIGMIEGFMYSENPDVIKDRIDSKEVLLEREKDFAKSKVKEAYEKRQRFLQNASLTISLAREGTFSTEEELYNYVRKSMSNQIEIDKDISEYITNLSQELSSEYNKESILTEDDIKILGKYFTFTNNDLESTKTRINNMLQNYIEPLKLQSTKDVSEKLDTGLKTNNRGTYISSLMINALSLTNCSNIDEINEWIDSIPNLYSEELYDGNKNYSLEELETIKRNLFEKYQDTMTSLETSQRIARDDRELASRYALHKKLKGLGLSNEEEKRLGDIGLSKSVAALYNEVEKICITKYGKEKGPKIYNKIVNYFTMDFDNINSSTYDQIKAFNEEIKSDIQNCVLNGGDYQLVISSLAYGNTVNEKTNENGNITYSYNYDNSTMGQKLSDKLGARYRLRSMINRFTAEEMAKDKKFENNKELVIQVLRDSLRSSLESFNNNFEKDGKVRTYELFNELIEIQKPDKKYNNVWEKNFGITIKEMIEGVIEPNIDIIKELKNKDVDFMYNETMLQESSEKREKVSETLKEIQKLSQNLITVFGDQDHTFCSEYSNEGIEQLKETAKFLKELEKESNIKIECTEKDLYFSRRDLERFKKLNMTKEEILKYKQYLLDKHAEIYADVPYTRECEWTVISNINGEFIRDSMNTKEESYTGKYTKISDMNKRVAEEKEMNSYNDWKKQNKQDNHSEELAQMLKPQQKEETTIEKETSKQFTKTNSNENTGSINILALLIIINCIFIIIFSIIFIIKH